MAKRFIKKVILLTLVSPFLLAYIVARILAEIFSELEDWTDDMFTSAGKALAEKLNILE
jgi:predicted permease